MSYIPNSNILEVKPGAIEAIRKHYNLDKPGQMKEAINILHNWVQKQNHFKKKNFHEDFYERTIITCKGSIERAKTRIDKICTMRTLLPQFFGNYNVKTDFGDLHDIAFKAINKTRNLNPLNLFDSISITILYLSLLPKLTDDYHRVQLVKFHDSVIKPSHIIDYFRMGVILSEYLKLNDYFMGFQAILDFSEANIMEYVTKINLIELRQIMSIFIEGYGMRIKSIHILNSSKLIEAFVSLLKQVLSGKLGGRIYTHKTVEELYEYVPKSMFPKDYGGEELHLKELNNLWIEEISSEKHMKYMRDMNEARTDESYRQRTDFNEKYAGMPGTFRQLSVD